MSSFIVENTALLLDQALDLMRQGFDQALGLRPFGALVARGNEVVSTGVNSCLRDLDPTAHAEIKAIRSACKSLGRMDLSDCVLYTSAQPCPMCQAACFHAGLDKILTITTWQDYADIFPDQQCADWMKLTTAGQAVASHEHRQRGLNLWDHYRHVVRQQTAQQTDPQQL